MSRTPVRVVLALPLLVSVHLGCRADSKSALCEDAIKRAAEAWEHGEHTTIMSAVRPCAEQGHATGQYGMGIQYAEGRGVPQDYREAAKWLKLAAEQGHVDAQYHLARMCAGGKGMAQDYKEAAKWSKLAAEQGNANAQLLLGLMYDEGRGVPQNYLQAHIWLNLAGSAGIEDAVGHRDRVASKMASTQIAVAQRLALAWRPKDPKK